MPTYAYACKQCGHRFDAVQSFSEPALAECPVCGGPLRKEYGSIGVTFNGSGFYRTDSRAESRAGSADQKGSAEKKSAGAGAGGAGEGASGSGSAGSKPEAKASPASSGS